MAVTQELHDVLLSLIQAAGLSEVHKQELREKLGLPEGVEPSPDAPPPRPKPPSYDELMAEWEKAHAGA